MDCLHFTVWGLRFWDLKVTSRRTHKDWMAEWDSRAGFLTLGLLLSWGVHTADEGRRQLSPGGRTTWTFCFPIFIFCLLLHFLLFFFPPHPGTSSSWLRWLSPQMPHWLSPRFIGLGIVETKWEGCMPKVSSNTVRKHKHVVQRENLPSGGWGRSLCEAEVLTGVPSPTNPIFQA